MDYLKREILLTTGGFITTNLLSACGKKKESKFIRLAFNENPLGPCKEAIEAMEIARAESPSFSGLNRYPDFLQGCIMDNISTYHNISIENIVCACGSSEIFNIVAMVFGKNGETFITPIPSFSLPEKCASVWGMRIERVELAHDHSIDLDAILEKVDNKTRVIYLSNPNNPTGTIIKKKDFENFLLTVWSINSETIIVLDEAYCHYVNDPSYFTGLNYINEGPLIITRTFSHAYGLAGARVGYALTNKKIAYEMGGLEVKSLSEMGFHCKLGANINRIAEAGANASLMFGEAHIKKTKDLNNSVVTLYNKAFSELGYEYIPSQANFVFVNVGINGNNTQAYLYHKNILDTGFNRYS